MIASRNSAPMLRVRPTRVEVDLAAVAKNAATLAALSNAKVIAVVKADAYGHGATAVSKALSAAGAIDSFAVSLVEEGVELRDAGVVEPILVMGPSQQGGFPAAIERGLTPMISHPGDLVVLAERASGASAVVDVHLKLDSGMGRLGLTEEEFPAALKVLSEHPRLRLSGVATHFAQADLDDPNDSESKTRRQLHRFESAVNAAALSKVTRHAANSAAALRFADTRLDAIRPGLSLYGAGPAMDRDDFAMTTRLVSEITQVRRLPAGTEVGYESRFRATRETTVAIVPLGYADGLPRSLSGRAEALIGGCRAPVIGLISMDITVVDVSDIPGVLPGTEVTFLGRDGDTEITTLEFADRAGISQYEVTCGISKRVPRVYR